MDNNDEKLEMIKNFIHAYNTFDIKGMIKDLHQNIKFENITNGQVDLGTNGIEKFMKQAEFAVDFFKEREVRIIEIKFEDDRIEVFIDYFGILSKDVPDGPNAGDTLRLKGKSIYKFKDNKIICIQDIS